MMDVVAIGLDLATNVFQEHRVDADGGIGLRRELRRSEVLQFFGSLLLRQRTMLTNALRGHLAESKAKWTTDGNPLGPALAALEVCRKEGSILVQRITADGYTSLGR